MSTLEKLRESTESAWSNVEALPLHRRVLSNSVTLNDYGAFLAAQLRVLGPWVKHCPERIREASGCDTAARLDALHLDLAALRERVIDEDGSSQRPFPWGADYAEWWGGLYVIEGARSGSRVIARHLRAELGICVSAALRFLDPPNDAQQPCWPTLLHRLASTIGEREERAAVDGAMKVIACYHDAYSQDLAPENITAAAMAYPLGQRRPTCADSST